MNNFTINQEKLSLVLRDKEAFNELEKLMIEDLQKNMRYWRNNPEQLTSVLENALEATSAIEYINKYEKEEVYPIVNFFKELNSHFDIAEVA